MKFLDYLFHGKELRYIDSYFKMLNGYSPTFTSYNGGVYEMDLTRTAVNSFATHCSKLKPEIEGSALKSLEKTLQHKPNYFMDTTKFIKRLATYVAVEHTAFIIPIEDEYGRLCGWYPLRAQRCEVVEAAGQVYLRYLFANGEHGAIEFERVGIMTDFEYTQNITDQRFNSAVCGIVTGTVEEIDASVLTKQFTDFFNTYSAAVLDEFSAYKQSMEKYLTEIAGVYDSYVSKTEGLFAQYESQFNERYSSFESTLDNWDKELLSAYTEFMAKIKLFQSDAENEFNTWFESIKDKLGEDIAGSLQLQIEELAAAMQEVKKQAEAGTKETKEAIAALDERLKRVESGWGIDYKHDAVLGLCYMGAAYMSQHYERTVETAVLGATYVGNSYLANTF